MKLDIKAPDYTTLCKRQGSLKIDLPKTVNGPIHLVVDSTGLKVYGEGEWKTRQHGYSKRRTWRKLHLGINADTHEIVNKVLSTNDYQDSELLPDILKGISGNIRQVTADSGYDSHHTYKLIKNIGAEPVIPPRRNAIFSKQDSPRNEVLRQIQKLGRKTWKVNNGYHKRSLAETAVFRIKNIFGDKLRSRNLDNQITEASILCSALNTMSYLGLPAYFSEQH